MVARLRALLLGYALYAAEIAFLAEFRVALVEASPSVIFCGNTHRQIPNTNLET